MVRAGLVPCIHVLIIGVGVGVRDPRATSAGWDVPPSCKLQ